VFLSNLAQKSLREKDVRKIFDDGTLCVGVEGRQLLLVGKNNPHLVVTVELLDGVLQITPSRVCKTLATEPNGEGNGTVFVVVPPRV
jgi:hypothetical protein